MVGRSINRFTTDRLHSASPPRPVRPDDQLFLWRKSPAPFAVAPEVTPRLVAQCFRSNFPEGIALTAFSSEAESLFCCHSRRESASCFVVLPERNLRLILLSFPKGICVSLRVALSHPFRKTALAWVSPGYALLRTATNRNVVIPSMTGHKAGQKAVKPPDLWITPQLSHNKRTFCLFKLAC